ncbi:MAG TPA: zf-HC2 domain-containing protein [Vicinamibacteria bacterium]|nr:zf-HC2 domain-containing protein [Vicinamibacteria bacterium]
MTAKCPEALELPVLVDYWFGELEEANTERVDEHLLACDDCSGTLQHLVGIGQGIRRLSHEGAFSAVVSPWFLDTARQRGLRIREYTVPPGGRVECTVTAEDDLLVSHLRGDFSGLSRLDLVAQPEGGPEQRVEDLPVDLSRGELILAQSMPVVRAMPTHVLRYRLLAHDAGGDRLIAEYTFAHTRSLP